MFSATFQLFKHLQMVLQEKAGLPIHQFQVVFFSHFNIPKIRTHHTIHVMA